jgi:hypothetical protein
LELNYQRVGEPPVVDEAAVHLPRGRHRRKPAVLAELVLHRVEKRVVPFLPLPFGRAERLPPLIQGVAGAVVELDDDSHRESVAGGCRSG